MKRGKLYLTISAFVYGFTPILAKVAYSGGADGVTLSFFRSALSLPLLFAILKIKGISLRLPFSKIKKTILLSLFGNALSIICLYVAYSFISVGLAMVLHYIYPLIILIFSTIFLHEKINVKKAAATLLVTGGIILLADVENKTDILGIALALMSGVFYAFNVIYLDRSGLDNMNYLKLTFYISVFTSIAVYAIILINKSYSFDWAVNAWMIAFIISILTTFIALPFFQIGVRSEGATTAGILSTLEPITGVVLGSVFLGEKLTLTGAIGCVLIVGGVLLIELKRAK